MEQKNITLRSLSGVLKDRASLAKASLYSKSRSFARSTVIRATTHGSSSAPKEYRLAALLSLGLNSRYTAGMCIKALMDRLHKTKDPFVALKCLFAIHNVHSHGSVTLQDELSVFPSYGGRNFLNMSGFRDGIFDQATSEYSSWVKWYAEFLEQTLITGRVLGYFICPVTSSSALQAQRKEREAKVQASSSSDLSRDIEHLVSLIIILCSSPNSTHLQRNDLIYDIVSMVLEDYRVIRYEIRARLTEIEKRSPDRLGKSEAAQVLSALNQFEGCKEKLFMLFMNRANFDGLWELITRMKPEMVRRIARANNAQPMICWTPSDFRLPWHGNSNGMVREFPAYAMATT